ncbi:MAG: sigma factor, partial [Acidobacteriota bacterium]
MSTSSDSRPAGESTPNAVKDAALGTETVLSADDRAAKVEEHRDFETATIPYLDSLYNTAYRLTRNAEDAQDLVQETYLKAYRYYDKFEKGTNLKA